MNKLQSSKLLKQITMPGSHDALINPIDFESMPGPGGTKANCVCQSQKVEQQAEAGSRFFDVRLQKDRRQVIRGFHSEMLAAKMNSGGFGETLDSMLDGFNAFLTRNTSEFIIVRISHTKQICSEVVTRFGRHPILQKLFRSTPVNLAEMPVARLRGKLVVVLGASDFKQYINPGAGFHGFQKYKDGKAIQTGLATCGSFASRWSIAKVKKAALKGQMNHHTHKHDHLLQVYWQRTDLSGGLAIQNAEPSISFVRVPASTFPLVPAPTGEFLIPVLNPNVELRDLGAGAVALRGELPSLLESTVAGAGIAGGASIDKTCQTLSVTIS